VALSQSQAAAEPSLPPSTVALVVAYADGRVNYELTSAIRRRFTTRQPTRDGWDTRSSATTAGSRASLRCA